mmetsp:Transcript_445/g.768  ORF Transcript_445/g.768 Transcript_445/m.768 type:complete len:277 (+) Transcript_445:635-1465(+)
MSLPSSLGIGASACIMAMMMVRKRAEMTPVLVRTSDMDSARLVPGLRSSTMSWPITPRKRMDRKKMNQMSAKPGMVTRTSCSSRSPVLGGLSWSMSDSNPMASAGKTIGILHTYVSTLRFTEGGKSLICSRVTLGTSAHQERKRISSLKSSPSLAQSPCSNVSKSSNVHFHSLSFFIVSSRYSSLAISSSMYRGWWGAGLFFCSQSAVSSWSSQQQQNKLFGGFSGVKGSVSCRPFPGFLSSLPLASLPSWGIFLQLFFVFFSRSELVFAAALPDN